MIGIFVFLKSLLEMDAISGLLGFLDAGLNLVGLFEILKSRLKKDSLEYQSICVLDDTLNEACRILGWEYDALAVSQEFDIDTLLLALRRQRTD